MAVELASGHVKTLPPLKLDPAPWALIDGLDVWCVSLEPVHRGAALGRHFASSTVISGFQILDLQFNLTDFQCLRQCKAPRRFGKPPLGRIHESPTPARDSFRKCPDFASFRSSTAGIVHSFDQIGPPRPIDVCGTEVPGLRCRSRYMPRREKLRCKILTRECRSEDVPESLSVAGPANLSNVAVFAPRAVII